MSNQKENYLKKIKKYALENKIPIVRDDTLLFLQKVIDKINISNILEIGTAIGYSALGMSNEHNQIHTIERDYNKYQLALSFLKQGKFNIEFIWSEALFYHPRQKYDLIFIDIAKAQYIKVFQKYQFFLKKNGIIICDNLNFHNLDIQSLNISRSTKRLIKKINDFKIFLKNNSTFDTLFLDIGDGLSFSVKK
ncbi:SAM-dependent methyltransferase [Candidatus Phytoplasma luffae]|uniref:SAM-dependent methyltransferase n=1 Tax=Loofah witches'-broom phytoplasma TaxID=35773 RepID=A0A975FIV2_LOWBP|nr:hypothetical protein [Candidatus Phytoplasma luffae]QTX02665.1 SAM-dependent methyltransferase [Candidatus Phytoplasma luffae]